MAHVYEKNTVWREEPSFVPYRVLDED